MIPADLVVIVEPALPGQPASPVQPGPAHQGGGVNSTSHPLSPLAVGITGKYKGFPYENIFCPFLPLAPEGPAGPAGPGASGGGGQLNFAGRFFPAAPAAPPELVESPVRLVGVRRSIPRVMFQGELHIC